LGGADPDRLQALQLATKKLFQSIIDIGEHGRATRRPLRFAQLVAETDLASQLLTEAIDAFRAPGRSFLVPAFPSPINDETVVDISHEALIRQWNKLSTPRGWLWEEQQDAEAWRQLRARTEAFVQNRRLLDPREAQELTSFWQRRRSIAWLRRYHQPTSGVPDDRDSAESLALNADQLLKASRHLHRRRKIAQYLFFSLSVLSLFSSWILYFYFKAREEERTAIEFQRLSVETIKLTTDQLQQIDRLIAEKAPASEISGLITQAQKSIDAQSDAIATVTQRPPPQQAPPPRVYIHITDEAQRPAAQQLAKKLEQIRIEDMAVVVPGIQLVKGFDSKSVLRCFRSQECQPDGSSLVQTINGLLKTPQVTFEDLSKTYGQSTAIGPRHFELWFGPGRITLAQSG
jgi:hypothetical protein